MRKATRNATAAAILLALAIVYWSDTANQAPTRTPTRTAPANVGGAEVAAAFAQRHSDVQVRGAGRVIRTLADDQQGSRHQRFILRLADDLTLLIAHNIDLAPRIPDLAIGDHVEFYGEYEYNERGGVVHWTHHDPAGRHPHGWLRHRGTVYQ